MIYYQFDKHAFLGNEPSHLDIENELPGTIVNNQHDLESLLNKMISNHYQIDKAVEIKANRFVKYHDQHNSERIFEAVLNHKTTNQLKANLNMIYCHNIYSNVLEKVNNTLM